MAALALHPHMAFALCMHGKGGAERETLEVWRMEEGRGERIREGERRDRRERRKRERGREEVPLLIKPLIPSCGCHPQDIM